MRIALQVQPGDGRRPHAQEREAAFMVRVDQFVRCGRGFGQNAEPRERVSLLVEAKRSGGNGAAADSVKAIAAADEIADDFVRLAAVLKRDARARTIETVQLDALGLEENPAAGVQSETDQILHNFVLGVDGNGAAVGQFIEVDAMAAAVEAKLDAMMDQPFAPHAFARARLVE